MPVLLKQIKKELQTDVPKVGKTPDGEYKYTPPNIVGRRVNSYPKLRITKFTTNPDVKNEKIRFIGLAKSETTSSKYKVTVEFHEVKFRDIETGQFRNEVIVRDGRKKVSKWHRNLTYGGTPVTLRCQCKDFRHRFQKPLSDAGGLYGGFIGYTRKTDPWPVGRPFANSTNKLGICKHINSMLTVLENKGILKNR
jgi:hypothetical protein